MGTLHRIATALDREITTISGERHPFALLIWTNGRANYVSNTNDRAAMKASIGALIRGWVDDPPVVPHAAPAPSETL